MPAKGVDLDYHVFFYYLEDVEQPRHLAEEENPAALHSQLGQQFLQKDHLDEPRTYRNG